MNQKIVYHVLIVDDQRDVRKVLRAGIETSQLNIEVTDVPSGEEAILVSSRQPVHLLVVDVDLPGISGLELKRKAEIRNPGLKFIIITGMTDPDVLDEIEAAQPDAFFQKPISVSDFLQTVQHLLGISIFESGATSSEEPIRDELPRQSLSERLTSLRQEASAACVVLFDDCGQYLAQAGNLPEYIDEQAFISGLMTTFSVSARVSSLLGRRFPKDLLEFYGKKFDYLLTHLGKTMGLLLVIKSVPVDDDQWYQSRKALLFAADDLELILLDMGVSLDKDDPNTAAILVEEQVESQAQEELITLPELDAVFNGEMRAQAETEDADQFWDSALAESTGETDRPDVISYEQARQLGLVPNED